MMSLLALFLFTVMQGERFVEKARDIRVDLVNKVAEETIPDGLTRAEILGMVRSIVPTKHVIGVDEPYSQSNNPDIPYLNMAERSLGKAAEARIATDGLDEKSIEADEIRGHHNSIFQQFRTLYYQMMIPVLLRKVLPVGMMGLFVLLMVMLMLSTDDGWVEGHISLADKVKMHEDLEKE